MSLSQKTSLRWPSCLTVQALFFFLGNAASHRKFKIMAPKRVGSNINVNQGLGSYHIPRPRTRFKIRTGHTCSQAPGSRRS